jgi:hypothetical protein
MCFLEAFQEVGGEVRAITRRIAVHCDLRKPVGDEGVVTLRRAREPAAFEPRRGPREGVKQHPAIAVEVA